MAQITYTNKVALNENPEIANINKVTDDDMNEIKQVVNDNYNNTIQITDTEPTDSDWKIWIDTGEIGSQVSEITNEYSTSIGLGYSANYMNGKLDDINEKLPEYELINLTKSQITNGIGRVYKYGKLCILYLQDISSTTAISSGTIFTGAPKPVNDLAFIIHRTGTDTPTRLVISEANGNVNLYYSSIPGDANKPAYGFFTYITKD